MKITRIIHVDLEGDGEDKTLISATNFLSDGEEAMMHSPPGGSYSMVLLRRVVAGTMQTQLIAGEIHRKTEPTTANVYEISAILDLNGATTSSKSSCTRNITRADRPRFINASRQK